jgi:YHS domain-containing protein
MCGDKMEDIIREVYKGEVYHFCSRVCRSEFISKPIFRRGVIVMETLMCTVCGNEIPKDEAHRQEYREEKSYEKYYFCCGGCRMEFLNDPDKYTGQSGRHLIVD